MSSEEKNENVKPGGEIETEADGNARNEAVVTEADAAAESETVTETDTAVEAETETETDAETVTEEQDGDRPEAEIESKIDAAMEKIVDSSVEPEVSESAQENEAEAAQEQTPEKPEPSVSAVQEPSGAARKAKSARPRPITYVPMDEEDFAPLQIPEKKKHKGLKITGIAAAMLVVAAGCAYAGASYYYADKFFEGTTINGIDCSGLTAYQVEQLLAKKVENYSLEVSSRNLEPQKIDGEKIGYKYVSDGGVLKFLKKQKPYEWVKGYWEPKSYSASENSTYDRELLKTQVRELNCAREENQIAAEDAYVAFAEDEFEIVPEKEGTELVMREAYNALSEAVSGSLEAVDFTENPEIYKAAKVTSDSPELKAAMDACNNFTRANITYTFGDENVTLEGSEIKNWLNFDEKGQLIKDDASFRQHINDFVAQLAGRYNTVGTEREFSTTSGRTVSVYGSAYGWQIDQAAEAAQLTQEIQSGAQVTREPVYSMTANSHGYNDLGSTYIEVDLSGQHMYYYQDGDLIFDSDIVSGNMSYDDRQTPSGIYTLYYKKSPDVLRGKMISEGKYEYEQPVNYWMPFNGGIGFHDAPWQPYFGGDRYLSGGSHGCINMPPSNAAELYNIIQYNVPIICFY